MADAKAQIVLLSEPISGFTTRLIHEPPHLAPPSTLDDVASLAKAGTCMVWLDIVDPDEPALQPLADIFGLSPFALEDSLTPHERPKIDAYGTYWFLVVQAASVENDAIVFHETAIFVAKHLVVTIRRHPPLPLDEISERLAAHPERCTNSSAYLLYTILDSIVDGYIPVAEMFTERVEDIEDRLFVAGTHLHNEVLPDIFRRKKEAQAFRRAAIPMRDILNQIVREDVDIFPDEVMPYFRDVYDHTIRVIDELDSARDLVASALDIHLSVTANRQNEVAKQLTIVATIFLPLGFLTGFFGQNFGWLVDHIGGATTFFWLGFGSEAVAIVALIAFFKIRGW